MGGEGAGWNEKYRTKTENVSLEHLKAVGARSARCAPDPEGPYLVPVAFPGKGSVHPPKAVTRLSARIRFRSKRTVTSVVVRFASRSSPSYGLAGSNRFISSFGGM